MPTELQSAHSTAAELDAILHGAAIAQLDSRGFLRITGPDAARWLNGMVTNNIQSLQPGEGNYNFLLNAQGRILGDCTVYRDPEGDQPSFFLVTDTQQLDCIYTHLDKFIIMDDVELKTLDYYDPPLLILGPKASDVLRKIEHPTLSYTETHANLPPMHLAFYGLTANPIFTPAPAIVPRFEVLSESRNILIEEAIAAGAVAVSAEALESLRILEGTPRYGVDIRNTATAHDLPQETAQTRALHFSKGCYLGQEIVERIRSRGNVHRTFYGFTLTGALPEPGTALTAEGKPVGELTSVASIPLAAGPIQLALGYIRREALDRKIPIEYPGGTATPTALPFALPEATPR